MAVSPRRDRMSGTGMSHYMGVRMNGRTEALWRRLLSRHSLREESCVEH